MNWDADKYTNNFQFVHQYGSQVLELLAVRESMTVLDLGCGNGVLTKELADKNLKVIGMDASVDLIEKAKGSYPELNFMLGDATSFSLDEKVDAVFSNAVFHWIQENRQKAMAEHVYAALKVGGQFVFEMGGHGNNQKIHSALEKAFVKRGLAYKMPFYFPGIADYAILLEQVGFKVIYANLFDRFTKLKGESGLEDWIRMFIKRPFENVAPEVKSSIIQEAVEELREYLYREKTWYADYVRLRMKVIKY